MPGPTITREERASTNGLKLVRYVQRWPDHVEYGRWGHELPARAQPVQPAQQPQAQPIGRRRSIVAERSNVQRVHPEARPTAGDLELASWSQTETGAALPPAQPEAPKPATACARCGRDFPRGGLNLHAKHCRG